MCIRDRTGRAAPSEKLLALTLERSGDTKPELQVWVLTLLAEMAQRRDAAMLRGDTVHQREQARFELLRRDTTKALALARKNWAIQKEPADMRIYLEAAVQARDREAAQPVLDWIAKHKTEDAAAARLVRQLGESA